MPLISCEFCGAQFKRECNSKGRFCSLQCAGKIHAIRIRGSLNPNYRHGSIKHCLVCGTAFRFRHKARKYCSLRCARSVRVGKNAPCWKGGTTTEVNRIRNSKTYAEWRRFIFSRDGYRCCLCQTRGGSLQAHHIKGFSNNPSRRLALGNGLTLCKKCHCKIRGYERATEEFFTILLRVQHRQIVS